MPTTTVKGLNVLAIYVADLARAEAFYAEHLGFEKSGDVEPGILMQAGDVSLYLEETAGKRDREAEAPFGCSPCFETDGVKASFEALSAAGVPIRTPYQEFGETFALFRIADPDGNLIEFAGAP